VSTPKSQCSEYVTSTNRGKLTNSEPERASRSEVHRGSRGITEQLEELQSGNGETKARGLSSSRKILKTKDYCGFCVPR